MKEFIYTIIESQTSFCLKNQFLFEKQLVMSLSHNYLNCDKKGTKSLQAYKEQKLAHIPTEGQTKIK